MAAGMGLIGMGGAAGAGEGIAKLFEQRMQMAEEARRQKQAEQADAFHRLQLQEMTDTHAERLAQQKQTATDRAANLADLQRQRAEADVNTIPTTQALSGRDVQGYSARGVPGTRFAPTPIAMPAPPESVADPSQPQGEQPIPGSVANSPQPSAMTFHRLPTAVEAKGEEQKSALQKLLQLFPVGSRERSALEYEGATGKNAPAAMFEPKPTNQSLHQVGPKGIYMTAADAEGQPAYHAPPQAQTVTIQTVDDQGHHITKIVPKTAGSTFAAPVGATTETRLASAQAVNQTGNDIIAQLSTPEFAKVVGPVLGRYASLRDFIGNPPPEFSELAGSIESYALASMGVHGMRSAQGAQQITKLLDQKHTPESLIATIKGLNKFSTHFLQNEGRGSAVPPQGGTGEKPTAADLIKKYGG